MKIRAKARPFDWLRYRLFEHRRPLVRGPGTTQKPLAIFKPERLGDFLLAQPTIGRLVESCGAANCTLFVSRACRALADRLFPEVEKIEVALEFSWGDWNWIEARQQTEALGRRRFEKAVSLTHHRKPALWSAWTAICAEEKIGLVEHPWMLPGTQRMERRHFDLHLPYPRQPSPGGMTCLELDAHAAVLNMCGRGPVDSAVLRPRWDHALPRTGSNKLVLGVVPGGSSRIKSLPDELVGQICGRLAGVKRCGVWLIGEASQHGSLERLRSHLAWKHQLNDVRVCCNWNLGQLEAELAQCGAVLSADTFTAHLATALNLPVAVLAAGGQPGVFGPWRNSDRQRWFTHEMDCSGCGWRCSRQSALCIEHIKPEVVGAFLSDAWREG